MRWRMAAVNPFRCCAPQLQRSAVIIDDRMGLTIRDFVKPF